jgi:hypothetical protein
MAVQELQRSVTYEQWNEALLDVLLPEVRVATAHLLLGPRQAAQAL